MKKNINRRYWTIFIVIFIFIFTLSLNKSIYLKVKELNGIVGYQKILVELKNDRNLENGLSLKKTEELKKLLSPELMTYYTFDKSLICSENTNSKALVYGVKGEYNQFYNIRLKKGSFLNEDDNNNKNYSAVIEDKLAKKLFKSDDVIGLQIFIYDKKFTIIGVVDSYDSIIGDFIEKDLPLIYIPLSVMNKVKLNCSITNIEFENTDSSLNKAIIIDKLAVIDRNPNDFYIEDYSEVGKLIKQRSDILLFIMGLFCIYKLIIVMINIIKKSIDSLRSEMERYYFFSAIKRCSFKLLGNLFKIGIILVLVILLWKLISFDLYIVPEKFPNDPTSVKQVSEILRDNVKEFLVDNNSSSLYEHRIINFLQKTISMIFIISLACELCIIFNFFRYINIYFENEIEMLNKLGIYFTVSTVLSMIIIYISGLPVDVSIKKITLLWTSSIILIYKSGKSEMIEENTI